MFKRWYTIHFGLDRIFKKWTLRLSKKFEGNISDIVPKILRDKVTINDNKKIFTEDTKGIKKIGD